MQYKFVIHVIKIIISNFYLMDGNTIFSTLAFLHISSYLHNTHHITNRPHVYFQVVRLAAFLSKFAPLAVANRGTSTSP